MTDDLVIVGRYITAFEAHVAKARLESAGIPAFVEDEYTVGMNWLYSNAIGGVKVRVPESLAAEAQELLASKAEPSPTDETAADACPECGGKNTGDFLDKRGACLTLLLLGLPLLLPREKKRCRDCGHRWRSA